MLQYHTVSLRLTASTVLYNLSRLSNHTDSQCYRWAAITQLLLSSTAWLKRQWKAIHRTMTQPLWKLNNAQPCVTGCYRFEWLL